MTEWQMFGYPSPEVEDTWYALGDAHYVKLYGCKEPVPVLVTEDPEGSHLGWIDADDEREGDSTPVMIHHKKIFSIQFPYGYKAEEKAGRGRAIPLRIEVSDR